MYQQVTITKENDGNKTIQKLYYEDNERKDEINLNEDTYKHIFEEIRPNTSISTPDSMIQGFLQNTKTLPTLLNNRIFTNRDLDTSIENIKDEMKYIVEMLKKKKKSKNKYLNKLTKKRKKINVKKKLLQKIKKDKKPNKSIKTKKTKRQKTKNPK